MICGHFINAQSGQLYVTQFGSADNNQTVLLLPSIFEEMNLSRAILAKQAQYLAANGYTVYCLDYFGTGDSQGEIDQANATIWLQDILDSVTWLQSKGVKQLNLFAMRLGGLLAMQNLDGIQKILPIQQIVLWKPVPKGKQFMTQFLRLKQANSMIQGEQKVNWREAIMSGEATEVAGYEINASLLGSIDELAMPAELPADVSPQSGIHWMELAAKNITPAVTMATKKWPQEQLHFTHFEGSAFWQIPEIFEQAFLHQATLDAFNSGAGQ